MLAKATTCESIAHIPFIFLQRRIGSRQTILLARRTRTTGRGWSLMIFCARATRGFGNPSLDARSRSSISPHPRKYYIAQKSSPGFLESQIATRLESAKNSSLEHFRLVVLYSPIVEGWLCTLKHIHYMLIDDRVFN